MKKYDLRFARWVGIVWILLAILVGCMAPAAEQTTTPLTDITLTVTQVPLSLTTEPSSTSTLNISPSTPDTEGWLAQSLEVVSDQPFEIQAFSIQSGDQVEGPVWSPDSSSVIVDHFFDVQEISPTQMLPGRRLWVLNLDGTGQPLDTNTLAATWSPDGHAIAYLRRPPDVREYELWVTEWPAGDKRQLATQVGLQSPFWYDNNNVVFATSAGEILNIDVATSQASPLTDLRTFNDAIQGVNFALSPGGDWLLLRLPEQEDKLKLLLVLDQNNTWLTPLPHQSYDFIVGNIAWSPTGNRLAFTAFDQERLGEVIHIVDTSTKQEWDIPLDHHLVRFASYLSWSPDENVLAFTARNGSTYKTNLYIINVDGSGLRNLSRDQDLYVRAPAWSPDGRYIFYSEYSDADFTRRPRLMEITLP